MIRLFLILSILLASCSGKARYEAFYEQSQARSTLAPAPPPAYYETLYRLEVEANGLYDQRVIEGLAETEQFLDRPRPP